MGETAAVLTDEVARAIFETLGGPDSPLSERMAFAEKLVSDQKIDLEKLKNKIHILTTVEAEQGQNILKLKEKTREVQLLLKQLSDWEAALDVEEAALKKQIARLEETSATASTAKQTQDS